MVRTPRYHPRQCPDPPRFQFRNPRSASQNHAVAVSISSTQSGYLRETLSLSGETNGGLAHPGVTPDPLAALAAPPMSDFTVPLTIKVHDAIDVIVALIVDYYGMFAIIAATIAN